MNQLSHTSVDRVSSGCLFAGLDSRFNPDIPLRRIINEDSLELVRIQESRSSARAEGIDDGFQLAGSIEGENRAGRNLVCAIINTALQDIEGSIHINDPRSSIVFQRAKKIVSHNDDFDDAVRFIFGKQVGATTDQYRRIQKTEYIPFNAYCELLGWDAQQIRAKLKERFPRLNDLITLIVRDQYSEA